MPYSFIFIILFYRQDGAIPNPLPFSDLTPAPPEVLDELLNVWIRDTAAVPMGDLEAGAKWARRLQQDVRIRHRLCNRMSGSERKRDRMELSVTLSHDGSEDLHSDSDQFRNKKSSSKVESSLCYLPPLSLSQNHTSPGSFPNRTLGPLPPSATSPSCTTPNNVEFYLNEIENLIQERTADLIKQPLSTDTPMLLSTSRVPSQTVRSVVPKNRSHGVSTPRGLSAAEDSVRPQFEGSDKLHRFERLILANSVSKSESSKLYD